MCDVTKNVRIDTHDEWIEVVIAASGRIEVTFVSTDQGKSWRIESSDYLTPEQKQKAIKRSKYATRP